MMNPWRETGREMEKERYHAGLGVGGGLRVRPADSESEWRNDVENVITVSI